MSKSENSMDSNDQGGNPSQQGGYIPQQGGYLPQQGGYLPQQGGIPHPYYPTHPRGFFSYLGTFPHQQGGYPFMGYPPPARCSGVNFQDLPTQPTGGSENKSENLKTEDKKSQIRWNATMDNILLDILIEAIMTGKKKGKKWDNKVWDSISPSLSQSSKKEVQVKHIENRLRQMKTKFSNFLELKNKSGASYDPFKQMVLVSVDFWKDLFTHPKEKKKFKAFRDRGLKWDFEKLSLVFGNSHTTGSYSHNGLDEMPSSETGEENMNLKHPTISLLESCTTLIHSQLLINAHLNDRHL